MMIAAGTGVLAAAIAAGVVVHATTTWNGLPIVHEVPTALTTSEYLDAGDIDLILQPLSGSTPVSAEQALAVAEHGVNIQQFTGGAPTVLLAAVTIEQTLPPPGSSGATWHPVSRVPMWLVTFTAPAPFQGCAIPSPNCQWVSHFTQLVNAETGQASYGFFTP
jgi:hypothetical protein